MGKTYDAGAIREKLVSDDRWLVRGILAIYARQTSDERSNQTTVYQNGIGFNGRDAAILSSFAKQILAWEATPVEDRRYSFPLSTHVKGQLPLARRMMLKYAGQLARIAAENNPVKDEVQPSKDGVDVQALDEVQAEAAAERDAIQAVERGEYDNVEFAW